VRRVLAPPLLEVPPEVVRAQDLLHIWIVEGPPCARGGQVSGERANRLELVETSGGAPGDEASRLEARPIIAGTSQRPAQISSQCSSARIASRCP
jgi:hypothetical protein